MNDTGDRRQRCQQFASFSYIFFLRSEFSLSSFFIIHVKFVFRCWRSPLSAPADCRYARLARAPPPPPSAEAMQKKCIFLFLCSSIFLFLYFAILLSLFFALSFSRCTNVQSHLISNGDLLLLLSRLFVHAFAPCANVPASATQPQRSRIEKEFKPTVRHPSLLVPVLLLAVSTLLRHA